MGPAFGTKAISLPLTHSLTHTCVPHPLHNLPPTHPVNPRRKKATSRFLERGKRWPLVTRSIDQKEGGMQQAG